MLHFCGFVGIYLKISFNFNSMLLFYMYMFFPYVIDIWDMIVMSLFMNVILCFAIKKLNKIRRLNESFN